MLRRRSRFGTSTGAASAATTTPAIAAARLLFAGRLLRLLRLLRGDCSFIARRTFASRLLLRTRRTLLLLLALLLTAALLATFTRLLRSASLLLAAFRPRRTCTASPALFFRRAAAGALLELLHLALHELAAVRLQFCAQRVVAAVRAALPSVRMRFLAGGAYDAFGQRHRNRRALYTSRL